MVDQTKKELQEQLIKVTAKYYDLLLCAPRSKHATQHTTAKQAIVERYHGKN